MHASCSQCGAHLPYETKPPSFCSQCGHPLQSTAQEQTQPYVDAGKHAGEREIPERVGNYRLLRLLGSGGMGSVYEAEEQTTGRRVALKLLGPDLAESADAIERFRREGRLASSLSHPRCVFVVTADEDAGRPYIVMELMSGSTLDDLVGQRGPLSAEEAINKILDVIDGLEQAHRLGIIHRDVKPSNCFVEDNGRVKVGDFGLSKALGQSHRLTQTGSFLGTPLFASPEQIKGETVDVQADVYSVAATLYYLLTGKPPFQGRDAAATLALVVSEPVASLRQHCRHLDPELQRVLLRGLEKNRARRWRNLAEFRQALLRCLPQRLSAAGLALRFTALLVDWLVLFMIALPIAFLLNVTYFFGGADVHLSSDEHLPLSSLDWLWPTLMFLYFGLLESIWGASPGKLLLRLRVTKALGVSAPGMLWSLLRSLLFTALLNLGTLASIIWWTGFLATGLVRLNKETEILLFTWLEPLGTVLGLSLMLLPMRARNGYRGLHELLSGTRVVNLPTAPKRSYFPEHSLNLNLARPAGCPQQLGPFTIEGALCWTDEAKVLLGQDNTLGRKVWLWLRPEEEPPLHEARRNVSRATRLRWLACGNDGGWQWDAFVMMPGRLLPDWIGERGRLSWTEARELLEQLTDELVESVREEHAPASVRLDQLWIQPDGTLQLLDYPASEHPLHAAEEAAPDDQTLMLLRQLALLTLEGQPRRHDDQSPLRAPIPLHAQPLLRRLCGSGKPYAQVAEFQTDLHAARSLPTEVSRPRRLAQLGIQAVFLCVGLFFFMFPTNLTLALFQIDNVAFQAAEAEVNLFSLQRSASFALAVQSIHPDPLVRLRGVGQWEIDHRLSQNLEQHLEFLQTYKADTIRAKGWIGRLVALVVESGREDIAKTRLAVDSPRHLLRADEWRASASFRPVLSEQSQQDIAMLQFILSWNVVFWPFLWVVWAFLTRGGVSFPLAGLALVRSDGRPAPRWRCAWRTMLIWMPIGVLLLLSAWLDIYWWSYWLSESTPGVRQWLPTISGLLWFAAAGMLLMNAAPILWHPGRSFYDRLAGTYVVPR